jgi:catechol 2,3-dioxygenase-like lactoylglutathione lyase family enzyme
MISAMKLGQVMVFAKDMERMRVFYRDGLGLVPVDEEDPARWLRFDAGGCFFALHGLPREIADRVTIADPPVERSDVAVKMTFHVDDVDAARARLNAHGARMRESRCFGDMVFCDGIDPEGNVFQIANR